MIDMRKSIGIAALLAIFCAGPALADRAKNKIVKISHHDGDEVARIVIQGTSTPTFSAYQMSNPDRIVLDIANAQLASAATQKIRDGKVVVLNGWSVNRLRIAATQRLGRSGVRLIITLARTATHRVDVRGKRLVLSVVPDQKKPHQISQKELDTMAQRAEKERARAATERARAFKEAKRATELKNRLQQLIEFHM